jgi:predicted Asp-tRNA(Asn)/Glu-tRNA(Gln) amidotransferase subunit C
MIDREEIKKEAEKVLEELSKDLGEVDLEETYFVVDEINVTREEGPPQSSAAFIKSLRKNASHMNEEGYFVMEMGKWVK